MKLTKITIALLCAGTLAFAACGKKDEEKKPADPAAEGDKPADPAAKPAETPTAAKPAADEPADDDSADEPAAEGGEKPTAEDMDNAFNMMKDLAAAANENKEDCAKMAAAMDKVVTKNEALVKKMGSLRNDEEAKKMWEEKYKSESETVMMSMMGAMQKCATDPAVGEVMKKMR